MHASSLANDDERMHGISYGNIRKSDTSRILSLNDAVFCVNVDLSGPNAGHCTPTTKSRGSASGSLDPALWLLLLAQKL